MEPKNLCGLPKQSVLLTVVRPASLMAFAVVLILSICCGRASAQSFTWSAVDIGGAPVGSYSYSSGTYTVGGGGNGPAAASDSLRYVYTPVTGNVEMIAQVTSQTNTSAYATAGLMMRGSTNSGSPLTASSAEACVTVSPKNGINFTCRLYDGATTSSTTLGPSTASPIYLRLVRTNQSLAGYYSTDMISWQLVGSSRFPATWQNPFPSSFDVGFAVSSNNTSLSTAVFNNVTVITNVPQRSANMLMWLRGDSNVVYDGSNKVSSWRDQSSNAYNGDQSTSANQPTLITNAINGLPAISFNGTNSNYLQIGAGFSNLTSGAQVFVVVAPGTQPATPAHIVDLGNGSASDNLYMQMQTSNTASYGSYSGSTNSAITTSSGSVGSSFQLLEGILDSSRNGTFRINGTSNVTGTLNSLSNLLRSKNYIGGCYAGGCYFTGQIAEIIIYSTSLDTATRQSVESYFGVKYGLPIVLSRQQRNDEPFRIAEYHRLRHRPFDAGRPIRLAQAITAPTITPGNGIYTSSQSVTITAPTGSLFMTEDGSTPTNASMPVTGPITVTANTLLKAVAYSGGTYSPVTSAFIAIDPSTAAVPRSGMQLWLRSDLGVTASGGTPNLISNITDMSGNGNDASQSVSSNQPALGANAVNGWPAVNTVVSGHTASYFNLPSGFANFTSGISIYTVANPAGAGFVLDLGNGSASNNITLGNSIAGTTETLTVYNGSTSSSVNATGALALNQFQAIGAIQSGSSSGTLSVNGTQQASGTISNPNNVTRSINHVAANYNASSYFPGQFSEIIAWNRPLTSTEQAGVNGYLLSRYQLMTAAVPPPAPIISLPTSALSAPAQVALESPAGNYIMFTTDGTTPSLSNGTVYSQPINVYYSQTIKAIAVNNGLASSVSSATYTLDATTYPAPATGGPSLQIQLQLPVNSIQTP